MKEDFDSVSNKELDSLDISCELALKLKMKKWRKSQGYQPWTVNSEPVNAYVFLYCISDEVMIEINKEIS